MLVEPRLELRVGRRGLDGRVLDEELELLPQTPPDDRVVAVEAQREGLARSDLLPDVVVDQALQLLCGRWPLPGPARTPAPGARPCRARRRSGVVRARAAAATSRRDEERRPGQEVQQRLAQQPPASRASTQFAGVYQIGEVYARSVMVIRVPGSGLTPKRFAS